MEEGRPTIVVGISGSRASAAALRWAAGEARLRRARLRVVRSWDAAEHTAPYATARGRMGCRERQQTARGELQAALHQEFGSVVPDFVAGELTEGMPERTLVRQSAGAELLVLGATAPESSTGQAAGPVVRACLSRAHCPVVVISTATAPAGG
jgi:nucleotide-binding universal stress UspA family protein